MSVYGQIFNEGLKVSKGCPFTHEEIVRIYEVGHSKLKTSIEELENKGIKGHHQTRWEQSVTHLAFSLASRDAFMAASADIEHSMGREPAGNFKVFPVLKAKKDMLDLILEKAQEKGEAGVFEMTTQWLDKAIEGAGQYESELLEMNRRIREGSSRGRVKKAGPRAR